jgi:dTDP-4-dehydrorhamnose 3,5-epimerase
MLQVTRLALEGVVLFEPRVFTDHRGYFLETYQAERYAEFGIPSRFVQDNLSFSKGGVLRGMHYQLGKPQGKLVAVAAGEIFDVCVDIRKGSPSFGRWLGVRLSAENRRQVYIPEGFAHGFCVLSESAVVIYKCTDYYAPAEERGIRWDDPGVAVRWPIADPILSDKDGAYPSLLEAAPDSLPLF